MITFKLTKNLVRFLHQSTLSSRCTSNVFINTSFLFVLLQFKCIIIPFYIQLHFCPTHFHVHVVLYLLCSYLPLPFHISPVFNASYCIVSHCYYSVKSHLNTKTTDSQIAYSERLKQTQKHRNHMVSNKPFVRVKLE